MVLDERGDNSSKITDIHYRQMCNLTKLSTKHSFLELASGAPGARGIPGSGVTKCCSDLPSTHAGGQDDGS